MDESIIKRYGNLERKQKFEQNVKGYLEAMDKIQIDLDKMLEKSMKINIIFQEAISQRAEQYLEHNSQLKSIYVTQNFTIYSDPWN